MRRIAIALVLFLSIFQNTGFTQNVFNQNDPIIPFDGNNPPPTPANTLTKWVRTNRVSFNTDRFKSYYFNNMAFRLRYPNGYDPNDKSKKYPVILFMHGGGEIDLKTNNDYQLFVGAELIQAKIDSGLFNAFLLFPQAEIPNWEYYYPTINRVLDSIGKYCNTDPEKLITMGVSMGGLAAVQYSSQFPKRSSIAIGSSPALIQVLNDKVNDFLQIPVWLGSGIYDGNPSVENVTSFVKTFTDRGGFIKYNMVQTAHESWYPQWLEQPIVLLWNLAYKSNPLLYYGRDQFARGAPIDARLGLTPGFYAYQWQKDTVNIPGASSSEYIATSVGSYSARFMRSVNSGWSDWSHIPVKIRYADDDVTPPSAPSNLRVVSASTSSIELNWDKSSDQAGIASYDIYQNDVKKYSSTLSSIVISDLSANTGYSFTVSANDPSGNASTMSNRITARTQGVEATSGLKYKYYEGVWNELPDFAQLSPVKSGFTGNVDISPKFADSYYSFVWEGTLKIPTTGDYTFEIVSDDGSKMYFNGYYVSSDKPLVNNDRLHDRPVSVSADKYITAGSYPVAFTFFTKEAGSTMDVYWSGPGIPRQIIPASAFAPDEVGKVVGNGLNYTYYEGDWNTLPDFTTLKSVKTGNTANFDLSVRNKDDYYGLLWEGNIAIPVAGDWTFEVASDDGSKFFFNSGYSASTSPLINNDGLHGDQIAVSGKVTGLKSGVYPIALAYFQKWGGQNVQLYWTGPNTPRQLVPESAFSSSKVASTAVPASISGLRSTIMMDDQASLSAAGNKLKISGAYPNPFVDKFTIEYSSPQKDSRVDVQIYDLNGKLVASKNFGSLPAGTSFLKMDINGKSTAKGIYIARVNVDDVPAKLVRLIRNSK
ncbi:MAG: PA14 domain-containing protein [Chitinophagaceae bacterium]